MRIRALDMTLLLVLLSFWTGGISQTYQIHNGDTINVVDANNLKQGHWIFFGKMKNLPGYSPEQKIEEGPYANNRKSGLWTKYFPNEKVNSEINYVNNRPTGEYKVYYKNGQLQEQGNWKNNRNVGNFVRYYENGEKQQEFAFNATGKRAGKQVYFYENGQVMIEGSWNGGKEDGEIKEYYANGDVKSVKVFNGGMMDAAKTQTFEPKQPIVEVKKEPEVVKEAEVVTATDKPLGTSTGNNAKIGYFNGTGNTTLFRKDRQISQKGYFKGGKLMDGKWYRYDENGILQTIELYKDGKYVGDAVIEE